MSERTPSKRSSYHKHHTHIVGTHYRLVRKLGEGNFGSVYLCIDTRTRHHFAAKVEVSQHSFPLLIFFCLVSYQRLPVTD